MKFIVVLIHINQLAIDMLMKEDIIDEYWSVDRSRCASIIKSDRYPSSYKLITKDIKSDKEAFKFHIFLEVAQDEAEDFILNA